MKHDQLRHLRSLRLLLSQDKSPLGFFLAAGCPRSVKDGGNPLLPDMKGLAKIISDAHDADSADSPYKRLMEEMGKAGKDTKNVEDVLTFIRSMKEVSAGGNVRGFSEAELTALEKDICESFRHVCQLLETCCPQNKRYIRIQPEQIHHEDAWEPVFQDFLHRFLL